MSCLDGSYSYFIKKNTILYNVMLVFYYLLSCHVRLEHYPKIQIKTFNSTYYLPFF